MNWLNSIYELTHLNFQRELWIEAKYSELAGSFGEAISMYFDNLNLKGGYDNPENAGIYKPREQQTISTFHYELSKYLKDPQKRTLSDAKILRDPEWQQLCKLGLTAWNEIKQLLTETEEIALTQELERKYGK
ncbi:MAG: hypothetical protein ACFHWX_18560 [Bacteroidota bacterium]